MALTAALATASRAIEVFSTGVQVAGQNIANANTPGYVREELTVQAQNPFLRGQLVVGGGVKATSVKQAIDQFLEKRIHSTNSDAAAASAREAIYVQLEAELRELGDNDLSSRFSSVLSAINEAVNQPEQGPLRSNVIVEGQLLVDEIQGLRTRVDGLRQALSTRIDDLVEEANNLIDEVESLNKQIAGLESNGLLSSEAGALRTLRYDALNRLSEIIPVEYSEGRNGAVDLYSGGDYILFTGRKQHLVTTSQVDRGAVVETVQFDITLSDIPTTGGELAGVFEGRDDILGGFVDDLDQLTAGLIFEFNKIHSSGEGLEGFSTITGTNKALDVNAALSDAGLAFTPEHGSFEIKVTNSQTGITETQRLQIDLDGIGGNDTTLEGLRAALDSIANISAAITTDGRLQLDADNSFDIRFSNDTSGVLAALGVNTFFTGSDSATIGLNTAITSNHNLLATGRGGGPTDNSNIVELATILDRPVSSLDGSSVTTFYETLVSTVAQGSAAEQARAAGLDSFRQSLRSQREQFSGVSLDEEAVRLIELQQAYAASAQVIRTVDELFQLLVNL